MAEMDTKQKCFMSTLARLKESSNDAVVSADFTDNYTIYMHVDRPVQDEFVSVLKEADESEQSELVLLCGSVGDGKSHILSYCKHLYPELISHFYVHNDSTASLYKDKPASYTLLQVLDDFSDAKIDNSKNKTIIAINLGTLSNFLEADVDNQFSRLKKYVDAMGILDEADKKQEKIAHFHNVNFADYHLYELSNNGPISSYLLGLLGKITAKTNDNVFYRDYCECCGSCEFANICPIKANYDMLSDSSIQNGITSVLIESIVKNKSLISTRSLMNFFYEIMVDENVFDSGSLSPKKQPQKIGTLEYFNSLLPNMLFGRTNVSDVLRTVSLGDPMKIRNEEVDSFFIEYENTPDVLNIFINDLGEYSFLLEKINGKNMGESSMYMTKESLLRLFIRLCWLTDRRSDLLPKDEDYLEYMSAVYAWNKGDAHSLKNIYTCVIKGVSAWNGQAEKGKMQLNVGNNQSNYHAVQDIEIKPNYSCLPHSSSEILVSFRDEIVLRFDSGKGISASLDLDFALYSLMKKITKGYVPNSNDKKVNIKCVEFVKQISRGGTKMDKVYIRDLSQKQVKEYLLSFDGIDYSFEVTN